jgi:predicted MPP superfamily phosphohydrolase
MMIFFAVVMLSGYGGMHYYLYRKLRWIFPHHTRLLGIAVLLLSVSLFVMQILADSVLPPWLTHLAWVPSVWLGFVFLFLVISGSADLLFKLSVLLGKGRLTPTLRPSNQALGSVVMTLLVCFYGYIAAQQVTLQVHYLSSSKLKQPVTVVQITDLHLSLLTDHEHIIELVARINALQADIIVSTGDLVDMQSRHLDGFSSALSGLKASMGKFAVFGNHEAFAGAEQSREFIERAGFTLLSDQGVVQAQMINIVGVDDPAIQGHMMPGADPKAEVQLLSQFDSARYTLLLKHQPVVATESMSRFDLQLSGHTHGGQIFPFNLLVHLFYRAPRGLSQVAPDTWLYVSNGTGTWGPPMRVLAKPEISVFYLSPVSPD